MPSMELQPSLDRETGMSRSRGKRGGWITFPFIAATLTGLMLAGWGWLTNLIVYLIKEFNVKSIDATQITNIVSGGINLLPIISAILTDSFLGSFYVVAISSCFSLLGVVLLTLTASNSSLRPPPCETASSLCQAPSRVQFSVLYAAIALASIGLGAMKFTLATMGANQFDTPQYQGFFFNWFFFILYGACVVSTIGIVYVEDSISWVLGFGLCSAAGFVGLAIFLLGTRFYRHDKPQGSPYTGLAHVLVSAIRKRNIPLSSKTEDYCHGIDGTNMILAATPSQSLRFLNRASLKTEGGIQSNGSITKPLRLSGTVVVVVLISTCISLLIFDRFLLPTWQKFTNRVLTPLQWTGLGHVFNVLSMAISALMESRRLKIAHAKHLQQQPGAIVPMSVLWLFTQLVIVGIGETFHFPGQVDLYYQEYPVALRSTPAAMISVVIGTAYYVSTALVGLIRNVTGWLPDNINEGRLDNLYWTLVVLGSLNFSFYLLCSSLYRYRNVENKVDNSVRGATGETETGQEA
ncbi:hypothetical protein SLEP1_g13736 [Rubroshorea leprosula]|uniref:Uncharacterized protein n=1 Tax=Rubroshorea leprosula TaxID=152421 RepID=A0AAV5IMN5_9ROSI|nr:hypothetical protein SLEP1_g13736 [Rubroshorea leprosula]